MSNGSSTTSTTTSASTASNPAVKREVHSVGPFILGKTLGEGTTGKVKVGFHKDTGFKVAIKIVRKDMLVKTSSMRQKVQREIAILKLLDHRNVLRLYDVYETSRCLFIVMELVSGGELFDYIVQRATVSPYETLRIFREIMAGVDYLHSQGVCHRDLKPENILLDQNGHAKIADLGMASVMREGKLLATSCGSPHYASPEVISGVEYDGRKADIWSCGVILYALMTSNLPFDDDNIRVLLQKVKRGSFFMPSFLNEKVRDLINRMLVVDPNKRITMEEIKRHPWFNSVPDPARPLPPIENHCLDYDTPCIASVSQIDSEVLCTLECLRLGKRAEIECDLISNPHSQIRAYYNNLCWQKHHPPSDIYTGRTHAYHPPAARQSDQTKDPLAASENVKQQQQQQPVTPIKTAASSVTQQRFRAQSVSCADPTGDEAIRKKHQHHHSQCQAPVGLPTRADDSMNPPTTPLKAHIPVVSQPSSIASGSGASTSPPNAMTAAAVIAAAAYRGRSNSNDPSKIPRRPHPRVQTTLMSPPQSYINIRGGQTSPVPHLSPLCEDGSGGSQKTPRIVLSAESGGVSSPSGFGFAPPVESKQRRGSVSVSVNAREHYKPAPQYPAVYLATPTSPPPQPTLTSPTSSPYRSRQNSVVDDTGNVPQRTFWAALFQANSRSGSPSPQPGQEPPQILCTPTSPRTQTIGTVPPSRRTNSVSGDVVTTPTHTRESSSSSSSSSDSSASSSDSESSSQSPSPVMPEPLADPTVSPPQTAATSSSPANASSGSAFSVDSSNSSDIPELRFVVNIPLSIVQIQLKVLLTQNNIPYTVRPLGHYCDISSPEHNITCRALIATEDAARDKHPRVALQVFFAGGNIDLYVAFCDCVRAFFRQ